MRLRPLIFSERTFVLTLLALHIGHFLDIKSQSALSLPFLSSAVLIELGHDAELAVAIARSRN